MFTYHTKETAPTESLPQFDRSQKNYGFIPTLHQIMAKVPIRPISTPSRCSSITPR